MSIPQRVDIANARARASVVEKTTLEQAQAWQREFQPRLWGVKTGAKTGILVVDVHRDLSESLGLRPHVYSDDRRQVYLNHPEWVVPSADLETESIGNIRLCAERGAWVFFDVADWRRFMWARPMKLDPLEVLPPELRAVLGLSQPPQPQPEDARRPDTVCAEIGGARQ